VVIGESSNFRGPEEYLISRGVKLIRHNIPELVELLGTYIKTHPQIWWEDIAARP
jgi:creatinine deaminase